MSAGCLDDEVVSGGGDEVMDGEGHVLLVRGGRVSNDKRDGFEAGRVLHLYKGPCAKPALPHPCLPA